MSQSSSSEQGAGIRRYHVLYVLGVIIFAVPAIHGMIGYYMPELVWMVPMGVIGLILIWVAERMRRAERR